MFPKPVRSLMVSRVWGYDPNNGKQTGKTLNMKWTLWLCKSNHCNVTAYFLEQSLMQHSAQFS